MKEEKLCSFIVFNIFSSASISFFSIEINMSTDAKLFFAYPDKNLKGLKI